MSSITHAIDAAETQKGKGAEAKPSKKQEKAAAVEGEEVKLSKKDLAKIAKKESKANAKAGIVTEENPHKPKGKPQKPAAVSEPTTTAAIEPTEEKKQE